MIEIITLQYNVQRAQNVAKFILKYIVPSFIYNLEYEFFCKGSKEKKVDLSFSEQLLRVVFSTFCGQN